MKTPEPPRSSRDRGKAGESAPRGETPLARFQRLATKVAEVDPKAVRALEQKEKKARAAKKRD